MPKRCFLIFSLCLSILLVLPTGNAQNFSPAAYIHSPVAGTWLPGFLGGPIDGSMIYGTPPVVDSLGNLFVLTLFGGVRVIDKNANRVWNLAGMGVRGYKDGPAETAMFDMGATGYPYGSLAVDSSGSVYVSDSYNHAIRKIYKNSSQQNRWWVSTYYTVPNRGTPTSLTMDSSHNLWTQDMGGLYKIAPNPSDPSVAGTVTTYPNVEYGKTCTTGGEGGCVGPGGMVADAVGHIYTITRYPFYRIYRIDINNGQITKLAGSDWASYQSSLCMYSGSSSYSVDGPAFDAVLFQDGNIAVTPDGRYVYFGGGDDFNLRRLTVGSPPSSGYTQTLHKGGTTNYPNMGWYADTCLHQGYPSEDWRLGGPASVTAAGVIYLVNQNPPTQIQLRKITPVN